MKNLLFVLFLTLIHLPQSSHASISNIDTVAYETQRTIVNNLLDERVKKFGEYDLSVDQKSGFFGLFKTNSDMQKSINILQEIVKMDNKILLETRNLLRIKDNQAEKFEELAIEYDNQATAYMRTISKLQMTNEKLNKKIDDLKKEDHSDTKQLYILSLISIILIIITLWQYKVIKSQKLTKL